MSIMYLLKRLIKYMGLPALVYLHPKKGYHQIVPIGSLRCQEKSFSELQGFAGKTIDYFPPCQFFRMALTDRETAYNSFHEWLHKCLIEYQAWKIPRSEGGWANGSLVRLISQVHQERGISLERFEDADPRLINIAIGKKVDYYLGLLDSIKENGFIASLGEPIRCRHRNGLYIIYDGHHRPSVLRVLGYQKVEVEVIE